VGMNFISYSNTTFIHISHPTLLWLANKEEKRYKYKTYKMKNIINTNTSKYIFY